MTAPALAPIDPNVADSADADLDRRVQELRRLIAAGNISPSRIRMARFALREAEQQLKPRG